jgi:prolyl oligopeptidase
MVSRSVTFYTSKDFLWVDGAYKEIPIPDDAEVSTFADSFLIELRSDWVVGGMTHVKGSLLSVKVSDLMAGKHDSLVALFTPGW